MNPDRATGTPATSVCARPSSISALRSAISNGELAIDAALAAQRDRFNRDEEASNCIVSRANGAIEDASRQGPLSGLALAHKDVFESGVRAPLAGRRSADTAPGERAHALGRLAARGASYLGALAMAELACGATAENPNGPVLLNPIDPDATVGGSSSGCAIAVAAGLTMASLGTDTAGSIRIPAATCGLVGLKPTHDAIDSRGVRPLAPSLDSIGVIARSASDTAQVYAALLPDTHRLAGMLATVDGLDTALRSRRDWVVRSALQLEDVSPNHRTSFQAFQEELAASGTRVESATMDARNPWGTLPHWAQVVLHVESAVEHRSIVRESFESLAESTRAVLLPGYAIPAGWYRQALAGRAGHQAGFVKRWLNGADVLLLPSLPQGVPDRAQTSTDSPGFDARVLTRLFRHHAFVNYLGLPAIVFPIGVDGRGRPVSVQAIARPHAEETLLAFAHQFARALR